jgi:cation:H+ antiporter
MGDFQLKELLLTAAQSLLAVALLAGLRLDPRGALLLFGLFIGQFLAPVLLAPISGLLPFDTAPESVHLFFSVVYIMASICFLLGNRAAVAKLHHGFKVETGIGELIAQPVLVESKSSRLSANPVAVMEAASRSSYRR